MAGHAKKAGFTLTTTEGTARNIGKYADTIDFPQSVETAEVTAFNTTQGRKAYKTGLIDGTISLGGPYATTPDGWLYSIIAAGAAGASSAPTYVYYPNTTAAVVGLTVKYTGTAILTSYNPAANIGDATRWTADLQLSGIVTRTTAP